jgi:methionyl-tRNA synthetase
MPKAIFAHGWWLTDDEKMSKSLGNVINPLMLIDEFGVDPVRYYLMSEMVLGLDATFSMDSFTRKYNSDLANDLGNLVSRVCTLISNNFDDKMPKFQSKESDLSKSFSSIDIKEHLDQFKMDKLLHEIMTFIRSVNGYMEKHQPWKMIKEDKESAGNILYHAAESLKVAAIMLSPVMPEKSQEILDALGAKDSKLEWGTLNPGDKISKGDPIFPRIVQ